MERAFIATFFFFLIFHFLQGISQRERERERPYFQFLKFFFYFKDFLSFFLNFFFFIFLLISGIVEREGLIVHFDRKCYLKFLREYKNKFFNVNYIDTIVETDQLYTIDNLNQKFTSAWLGCTFFFSFCF